ncbi:hypothetical protein, partial [Desulfovibrio sp. MES5]|uniref:hypothetical protein n=1 Tax=Desulfovibrio sp. MES5 TaxID=1899016 RepID=UPI0025BDA53F
MAPQEAETGIKENTDWRASWKRAVVPFGKANLFLKQEWTLPSSTVSKKVKQRRQTEQLSVSKSFRGWGRGGGTLLQKG